MEEDNKTIKQWEKGLRIRHVAHSIAFSHYAMLNRVIGLISTLLSALVATAIFTSISETGNKYWIVIAGLISIITTLTSAATSFLKYGELAAMHNQALASFGKLRRDLELKILEGLSDKDIDKLQEINKKWSELEKSTPAIPNKIYDIAHKKVNKATSKEK